MGKGERMGEGLWMKGKRVNIEGRERRGWEGVDEWIRERRESALHGWSGRGRGSEWEGVLMRGKRNGMATQKTLLRMACLLGSWKFRRWLSVWILFPFVSHLPSLHP